ncbi:hypothetical protein N7468_003577 [Penicillium chermesinum]|uniref:CHAT domain-containing protein n=1 Tax=Penicillium chermesinum TaxID=63820 RepID=A0A9W9TSD9_9EURO|nr:uncharacterized protein N7468_003577 [Penicillium chermesinum]KAJ5238958.1 hypothetical protein N7468_003577 [Penicillium chermesinum]
MDFEHFLGLCGRSLFAEEHRGDFDAAWDYLHTAKSEAFDPSTDLTLRAEYLRCASIYSILTGDFAEAYENLDLLHGLLEQVPPEWGLRYTNYKVLADATRRAPPMLRFYHERGRPLDIKLLGDVLGPNDLQPLFMANVQKYFPTGVIRDQLLCQMMPGIQGFPVTSRTLTAWFHPLSPGGSEHQPHVDPGPTIAEASKFMVQFRDTAEANGARNLAVYLTRLIAQFHVSANSPQTARVLGELYQKCESFGDYAGMANAKLIEGDRLLCAPFASPLSLNLVIIDAASIEGADPLWDPIEFDLGFDYSAEVQGCYESALELFRKASSKRGQAAVLLRQACCLHHVARLRKSVDKNYLHQLGDAHLKLREALALFGKDQASVQIVKAHQILLNISRGNSQGLKAYAREIGDWCASRKNEVLGHFLGLLLLRFAYQEWNKSSNMDNAVIASECAYELFSPIKDLIPLFQSVVARASVHHEMFNQPASQILIDEAIDMFDEVREYLDTRLQSAPDTPHGQVDKAVLTATKCTLLWTFGRIVSQIYFRAENLDGFQKWQIKQAHFVNTDASFVSWRESFESGEYTQHFKTFNSEISYPAHKTKGLWRKLMADEAAKVKFGSACITYRKFLFDEKDTDVLKAEEVLRKFVSEAEELEKVYTRDLYRIIACDRIGDLEKAREILDSITDDELFDGNLEDYQNGIGLRASFALVAQLALRIVLFGGNMARARRLVDMIVNISPSFFDSMTDVEIEYSERLGDYATTMMDLEPENCFSKLLQACRILENRRKQTTDVDALALSSDAGWSGEIYLNLARLSLRCERSGIPVQVLTQYDHGHFDGMSWVEHALLFVEMSRARAVLESLQSQGSQASGVPAIPKTASEAVYKRRLLRSLLSLQSLTPEQEKEVTELREYLKLLEGDEALSSATAFIETANSTIDTKLLYKSIEENAVVIEAKDAPINNTARRHEETCNASHENNGDDERVYRGEDEGAKIELNELSKLISDELLSPFAEIIRTKSHVVFSISDPLTAFPFSILPFEGKPLIIHAAVSQVPSLTILYYLSQRKPISEHPTVSVLAKSPTKATSSGARVNDEADLHMAGIEAVNIARTFATWPIEASDLTRTEFQQHVEGGSLIMHIGTHGNINYRNPLLSSISIGPGQEFRVIDMSAIRSNVHLLVFAACLSGLGKATTGSEVLGFSHIVLSSGCQAFIGSLWEVSDFGSMLIMTLFYRHLKRQPDLAVAELMRMAQVEILQLDLEKAGALLDDLMDDWASAGADQLSPAEFVPDAEFLLLRLRMLLDQLDWSSPFYWAPFTLIGYGGFRFVYD